MAIFSQNYYQEFKGRESKIKFAKIFLSSLRELLIPKVKKN